MATYQENLAKIRGQAVYGPEMREAIAEAIEQSDDEALNVLATVRSLVENRELFIDVEPIESVEGDYSLVVTNASPA